MIKKPRSICAAGTLRRAARSITRMYDRHLAPAGLTTTQFSILRRLDQAGEPVPLTELAEELVFERTSLYRALEPLRRQRLVTFSAASGRAKAVALTTQGRKRTAAAFPRWQAAQDAFLAEYGATAWSSLASELINVVRSTRATIEA